ncbi:hypothetical protein [Sphingomonas sp. BAUL-RG-20F-R05-02]|uniref:hypothetical protein n=1 Tax=Sphingomonas sp. BAUL-RG-20F-R05-02 TaxID=2914830 RepID=UPI001F56995C|nr:hypothetical protein [Sphingomonas sp. BAUL-RG-20F-R05-02]
MIDAILLALTPAPVATPAFHPIEGATYRSDTNETRTDDGGSQHFHASRRIVFRREATGYVAETTIDSADQSGPQAGSAFLAGNRAFFGRVVRVHLDAAGAITAVDDADALIERLAASIETAARSVTGPARAAAMAAPLRAFDPAQRRAMLGSAVADLIRPVDVARPDGTRTVALPSRVPTAAGQTLPGIETVRRDGDAVSITTHAAGPVTVGGTTVPGAAAGTITLDTLRRVDTTTGLIIESRSARFITTASGARSSRAETVVTLRLEP